MRITLKGSSNHHVQCSFSLGNPTHAVSQACRSETVLTKTVTISTTAKNLRIVYAEIFNDDLGVSGRTMHGFNLADIVPALGRTIDNEGSVCSA